MRWISIKEKEPKKYHYYLIYCEWGDGIGISQYKGNYKWDSDYPDIIIDNIQKYDITNDQILFYMELSEIPLPYKEIILPNKL
jgi:hypothetical protein